jgi:hypothetical protein
MRPKAFECLHINFCLLYSNFNQILHVEIPQFQVSRKSVNRLRVGTSRQTEMSELEGAFLQHFVTKAPQKREIKFGVP